MSTDNYIDSYLNDKGQIQNDAPKELYELSMVYSPNTLKKYVNNFLTTTGSFYGGTRLYENKE